MPKSANRRGVDPNGSPLDIPCREGAHGALLFATVAAAVATGTRGRNLRGAEASPACVWMHRPATHQGGMSNAKIHSRQFDTACLRRCRLCAILARPIRGQTL